MRTPRFAPAVAVALFLLAVAGHAIAGSARRAAPAARPEPKPVAKAPTQPASATAAVAQPPAAPLAPASAGLMVGIDPETGLLGIPTPEQRLQLTAAEESMLSRSSVGLVERHLPGGGVLLDLDGRFQELSFVRLGPSGRYVFGCANDAATLRRGLAAPQKPAVVYEDR